MKSVNSRVPDMMLALSLGGGVTPDRCLNLGVRTTIVANSDGC